MKRPVLTCKIALGWKLPSNTLEFAVLWLPNNLCAVQTLSALVLKVGGKFDSDAKNDSSGL